MINLSRNKETRIKEMFFLPPNKSTLAAELTTAHRSRQRCKQLLLGATCGTILSVKSGVT